MKRLFIPVLVMAASAIISCEKTQLAEDSNNNLAIQEEEISAPEGTYIYSITAGAEAAEEIKSDYSTSGSFSWAAGDAISVLFHNGTTNKFFTLTTTDNGSSATFRGAIEDGYTIGASDGDVSDLKIWALYPASDSHSYTEGSNPKFYIPASTDFTADGAHFSANMPMYDLLAAEGDFAFKHLACAYKLNFTDLDDDVTKVQITVANQTTYALSGSITVHDGYYLDQGYSSPGSVTSSLTYTVNVANHKASVYVPCRYYATCFQPIITLTNCSNGNVIKEVTAANAKAISSKGKVQPINIVASGSGVAWSYPSKFGIDWSAVTVKGTGVTTADYDGLKTIKATADANYLYILFNVDKSKLLTGYDYTNYLKLYLGNESSETTNWKWGTAPNTFTDELGLGWLLYKGNLKFSCWEAIYNDSSTLEHDDDYYYEISLNRSAASYLASTGKAHVGVLILNHYYAWDGSQSPYMYGPSNGSLLEVDLP